MTGRSLSPRVQLLELEANASGDLTRELSRFPELPRGALPSRAAATQLASDTVEERKRAGVPNYAAMKAAVARVKSLANDSSYDYPGPDKEPRLKTQSGVWFSSDVGEDPSKVEAVMVRVANAAGLGKAGGGNRTSHRQLGEMVRALLDMQQLGIPLPAPTIQLQHLDCPAFVEALKTQNFLLRADITGAEVDERSLTKDKLRTLSDKARHRIKTALQVLKEP